MSALVAALVGVAVLSVAAVARPRSRPGRWCSPPPMAAAGPQPRARAARITAVGAWLRRVARRPPEPRASQRVGWAAVLGASGLLIAPPVGAAAALGAWVGVGLVQRRQEQRRLGAVVAELPEVIDLLLLAVGAGLNVSLALHTVARRAPPLVGTALGTQLWRNRLGVRLADALDELPTLVGEPLRPLVAALVATERYGVPLEPALERLATEARLDRRRRAEEAARRVPVKLLFPLVLCVLPAFALLTVVPILVGTVGSLGP